MRGSYLMSPLGCRAGQSPRGPLHARGAGQPALRHKSSSSSLPAGSTSFSRPGRAAAPGAGQAPLSQPRRCGGSEGGTGGGRRRGRAGGGKRAVPSLPLTPPGGRTLSGRAAAPLPAPPPPSSTGRPEGGGTPSRSGHTAAGPTAAPALPVATGTRRGLAGSTAVALIGPGPGRYRGLPPSSTVPLTPPPSRSRVSPPLADGGSLWRVAASRAGSSRRLWRAPPARPALRRVRLRGARGGPGPRAGEWVWDRVRAEQGTLGVSGRGGGLRALFPERLRCVVGAGAARRLWRAQGGQGVDAGGG